MTSNLMTTGFQTPGITMQPVWKVSFQAPIEDIDRIFDSITNITQLVHGKTDHNGYRSASGQEYYRPREGTPTGAEDELRKRPGVDDMFILIPRDETLLNAVIEAIYAVHSYYEPVIIVSEVLRSETRGLDDSQNPHRWWNKDGDWKNN